MDLPHWDFIFGLHLGGFNAASITTIAAASAVAVEYKREREDDPERILNNKKRSSLIPDADVAIFILLSRKIPFVKNCEYLVYDLLRDL